MRFTYRITRVALLFQASDRTQATEMSFCPAKSDGQINLDEVPGDCRFHGPTTDVKDVHVIVFDTLSS
jgi:hypothetical protein